MAKFKQRCFRCKKNYVLVTGSQRYALCYDCQKGELKGEIKDPEMKKMFDLPEWFYESNSFLRNIKANYLRYGKLTENQINAFKKTVEQIKSGSSSKK